MKVCHRVNRVSGDEKLIVGFGDSNYEFTLHRNSMDKNDWWNHKRLSRISSWRWIKGNSISVHFIRRSYRIIPRYMKEVDEEVILKILYHYRSYLESCGLRNFGKLRDVIL